MASNVIPDPTRLTLIPEKEELHRLNNRLSIYIDTVQNLERENSTLNKLVLHTQEKIKRDYELELKKIRTSLDETAKEKAAALMSCEQYRIQVEDLSMSLNKKSQEAVNLFKDLERCENLTKNLQRRLDDKCVENTKLEQQVKNAVAENDTMTKEIMSLKKELDQETLQNIDLENRLLSAREELAFKDTVHKTIISETIVVKEAEFSQLNTHMLKKFDEQLENKVKDLRAKYNREIQIKKNEIESSYEKKIMELQVKLDRQEDVASRYRDAIKTLKAKIDSLNSKNSSLESNNIFLVNELKNLDKTLAEEVDMHKKCRKTKDEQIVNLKEEMRCHLLEYKNLLDLKIALDDEISTYRKLLQYEETRLNISDSSTQSETPLRGIKRLRGIEKTTFGSKISSESSGDILLNQDLNGVFIKVHNTGCQEVCLGDWKIIQKGIGAEVNYQFNSSVVLKPTETITVWSYNSNVTDDPLNLVMNSQKWCSSSPFLFATLLNNNGDEVASTETVKVSENSEVRYMEE